jgi:tetratricopeptide (TPR) repeat protein
LGELAAARAAYERALAIGEATYGPSHPTVATDVNNLGMILRDLGELAAARAAYERAVQIFQTFLGAEHPSTKIAQAHLDAVIRASGASPDTA